MILKPILALHIMNFSSCQNYWGGRKTICLPPPPNIFIGGVTAPPPQDLDASGIKYILYMYVKDHLTTYMYIKGIV